MPVATVSGAVADVELFMSSGFSQRDEPIQHQLMMFEAYELVVLLRGRRSLI
jgi:hypothetical protein